MARRAGLTLAGGGEDRFARRSPLSGEMVPQAQYRREKRAIREAERRSTSPAQILGERAQKVPGGRKRGQWGPMGTQGNRVLDTRGQKTAEKSIRSAAHHGNRVIIEVAGDISKKYPDSRPSDAGKATLGGRQEISAADVAAAIREQGSTEAGIAHLLMSTGNYASVSNITSYSIKEIVG